MVAVADTTAALDPTDGHLSDGELVEMEEFLGLTSGVATSDPADSELDDLLRLVDLEEGVEGAGSDEASEPDVLSLTGVPLVPLPILSVYVGILAPIGIDLTNSSELSDSDRRVQSVASCKFGIGIGYSFGIDR